MENGCWNRVVDVGVVVVVGGGGGGCGDGGDYELVKMLLK